MCLVVESGSYSGDADFNVLKNSFTELGIYALTEFMNPKVPDPDPLNSKLGCRMDKEMPCLESFARRVVGLLGYSALFVAALVEGAVRLSLALVALLPALCLLCVTKKPMLFVLTLGAFSFEPLLDGPVRCISGIVQKVILDLDNGHGLRINFTDLGLCNI